MECNLAPLSREGVVSSDSVIATGLCSRHGSEFGTLEHCRFAGLRPGALAIVEGLCNTGFRGALGGVVPASSCRAAYELLASNTNYL